MKNLILASLLIALFLAAPALAQEWYWFSPQGGNVSNDNMSSGAGIPASVVRLETSVAGDLQWYYVGLAGLPASTTIDSITVCYELATPASFLSQIRITRLNEPDVQYVVFDEATDLVNAVPECVSYDVGPDVGITGAITVGYRCNFASPADWIEIGAIGLRLVPNVVTVEGDDPAPRSSLLDQNHPNPFNPNTTISFDLPREQRVEVSVYTVDGKHVATLRDEVLAEGQHEITWNGRDDRGRLQASGVYLYRLETENGVESRRMTLVR